MHKFKSDIINKFKATNTFLLLEYYILLSILYTENLANYANNSSNERKEKSLQKAKEQRE